ncbi:MAG TPA: hypothetical protein VFE33_06315 [Thermoanaerobaculia bacterium]|nr:hypothetical protein [Thermoanaerobaculia bacterium]
MSPSNGPTAQDLTQLLDRLRPRIARLFEHYRVSEPEAEKLVRDALVGIAYRWGRVQEREQWVLDLLARQVGKQAERPSKEPEDE